jgi:predicted nuclease of predicted toxin-antitoxin system
MKFLLDQGLPRSTVLLLDQLGVTAEHVGDLGMATASDAEILAAAINREAIVVSLDSDFHALLAMSGASGPSVIRIRIEGLRGQAISELLLQVYSTIEHELEAGAVASVTHGRVRVRALPIGKKTR